MTDLSPFTKACPDCNRLIFWPFTKASSGANLMPVDAEPMDNGNVLITVDPTNPKRILAEVLSPANSRKLHNGGYVLYQHHRMWCSAADKWARPQRRAVPAVSTAGDLREVEGLF